MYIATFHALLWMGIFCLSMVVCYHCVGWIILGIGKIDDSIWEQKTSKFQEVFENPEPAKKGAQKRSERRLRSGDK